MQDIGYSILWLILPYSLIIYTIIYLSTKVLFDRYLRKEQYFAYCISVLTAAYIGDLAVLYIEYIFRRCTHLPQIISNPFSPSIFLYTFLASLLVVLTSAGFLLWRFYEEKRQQQIREDIYKCDIRRRRRAFRDSIDMTKIKSQLQHIRAVISKNQTEANQLIRSLSESLRDQLYANSAIQADIISPAKTDSHYPYVFPKYIDFFLQPRYHILRHGLLILIVALISSGLLFDFPDKPMADRSHISYAVTFFIFTITLIYLNLYLIFPLFQRRARQRLYACLIIGILTVIFVALNIFTFSHGNLTNEYGVTLPHFLIPFGIAGNLLSFLLLFAGTLSIVILKQNMLGKWRLNQLETERAYTELEILKQQISPHTLFNLLNNISILSYDDPHEAAVMLRSFEEFLEYILSDGSRDYTTIGEEISFIENYITLEKSTGRKLTYSISYSDSISAIRIPPLLLIPLVENAIKHSLNAKGERYINLDFRILDNYFIFVCSNPYLPPADHISHTDTRAGGLGLSNTQRRLELLYGRAYTLQIETVNSIFTIKLKLPYEMYSDR